VIYFLRFIYTRNKKDVVKKVKEVVFTDTQSKKVWLILLIPVICFMIGISLVAQINGVKIELIRNECIKSGGVPLLNKSIFALNYTFLCKK